MASIKNSEKSSASPRPAAREIHLSPSPSPAPSSRSKPRPAPKAAASLKKKLAPRRTLVGYARLTWLYEELKAGRRWNKAKLEKELGVSRTIVVRLLRSLELDFQQKIAFDPKHNSFVLVDPSRPLPHIPATEGELFALLMAQEALAAHQDSIFGRSLQGAINKLSASVNRSLEGGLAELQKSICFRTLGGSVRHSALTFDTVAEALGAHRELYFEYQSHQRAKLMPWKAKPRCLVRQDGVWYLLCHRGDSPQGYTLSLSRMSNLRLSEKTFEPEGDGPTLRESLASSIGIFGGDPERVRIRFRGVAARLVGEMALHPSQEMAPAGEKDLELTMEVAVNGELERWILGWGEQAEVMESATLRETIAGRLRQTAALYQAPPAAPLPKATPTAAAASAPETAR